MLSTTVASPCQILRELLAGDRANSPAHPLAIPLAHTQFAEGLHFSAFHLKLDYKWKHVLNLFRMCIHENYMFP